MVSRIEVIPSEVRGYGNIIEAKSLLDFVPVESDLVYSENVYSLTAVSGVHISLTASSSSINVGSSVTLTATVVEDDTPVTGETVSFYDGETLLGSDSTDSSGVATYSASALTVGAHSLSAVYGEKTSNLVNVTVNKITSTLSISVSSSSISYGDSVTISGTLSVGSGESVKVYQGNTLLDTVTTSTGGAYSKTVSGLSVGAYSFHTVYDGDSTHSEVSSSNVSVTVNKLTPTISLSVPASGTVGTSYTVSGSLVPSTGSVKLYENGSLKDTLTVSSGSFSKAITQSNEGTYSYYVVFEGSSTYDSITSSTSSIVVSDIPTPSFDGISLTGDKNILSAADSEYATLTAQLTDGGSAAAVSGETVTFTVYKDSDDSVVTTLTDDTDSTGVATVSYYGQGTGDIYIQAECTFVSETFSIEDCLRYDDASTDKTSNYSTTNLNSLTHSTDKYVAYRSISGDNSKYYSPIYVDDTLPTDYEISVDMYSVSTLVRQDEISISTGHPTTYQNTTEFGLMSAGARNSVFYRSNGTGTFKDNNNQNLSAATWYNYLVRVEGTTVTTIIKDMNGTVKYTNNMTVSFAQDHKKWSLILGDTSHTTHFRKLKIKPL